MFALSCIFYTLLSFSALVSAFSFTHTTLSECDDFTVEWSGGTGPYQLLVVPSFGTPRNISIPPSAYSNGRGSFTTRLDFAKDSELLLTMSDATGFGAGGSTPVQIVEESQGGSCDTTDIGIDFPFQLNYALQQCRGFIFEGFETAAQPVTIWIVVPGGTSTTVQVPMGASRYEWTANVPGGTSVMFFMTDARGGQGGASDVRTASRSDDRSCLDDQALSSTMTSSTAASTPTSSTEDSRTASPTTEPSESAAATAAASVPISAIAGTVIGSLLFLAVIVTLGLFFLKNFKKKHDRMKDAKRRSGATAYSQDPYGNSYRPPSYGPSSTNLVSGENPFADSTSNIHSAYANYSSSDPFQSRPAYPPSPALPTPSSSDPFNPSAPPILPPTHMNDGRPTSPTERSQGTSMTSAQRKAAMAGETSHKPQRFIVHTDLEDALPPPSEDEVVELPPMYTERRGPSNFTVANTTPEDLPPPPSATHTYSFSQPNRSQPFS